MSGGGAHWGEPTPIERVDGHLRLEDIGLLGDGDTACLIGRDGSVQFLCAPFFDGPPLFCPILDSRRGGCFRLGPARIVAARHRYERDLPVLVTELTGPEGTVRITDLMTLRAGADLAEDTAAARGELLRRVEIVHGRVDLRLEIEPFGGADVTPAAKGFAFRSQEQGGPLFHLEADRALPGPRCDLPLREGDRMDLLLRWGRAAPHGDHPGPERLAA
jgi:alpha,alpha-trehalase